MIETRAELVAELAEVKAAISKARIAQSASTPASTIARANLAELRKDKAEIIAKIEAIDAASKGGNMLKAKFKRPI